ncbi:MAG: delta-60 repeat domain-containing protein [Flavobacteriales bacterium]|nr:delta-60 repeat domain-containing protein [Flavobacteriales bacterium]
MSGSFTLFNGVSRNGIARLNTDGSLDTGFDPGSGVVGTVYSLNIQADGKIILTGNFLTYNGIVRNNLARVNSNGSLDTSFDPGTGANFEIADAVLQPDGKLLIGGSFTTYGGVSRNRVARVLANGMLDSGFNPGTGASDPVSCIALRSDGRVMIGGSFINYNSTACGRIARLNSNGSLDATFNTGTGANGAIDEISIQPDGKIVLGGSYTVFNGTGPPYLVRVNTNGTFDTGFAPAGDGGISSIALRADGSMFIGGVFTTMGGYGYNGLAHLNTDGNTDLTFNPGSGVNSYPTALAVQQDGKVLLGGGFSGFNGPARKFLARPLPDG